MRWQKAVTVIATVLIVAVLAVVLMPVYANHARLGLDLQGGVMVRLDVYKRQILGSLWLKTDRS